MSQDTYYARLSLTPLHSVTAGKTLYDAALLGFLVDKDSCSNRNRTDRLDYRANQAYIKGPGRRKLGKAARLAAEERRKAELSGDRIIYRTELNSRPGVQDPHRTRSMKLDETDAMKNLVDQKKTTQEVYLHEWQVPYIKMVEKHLQKTISEAQDLISRLPLNRRKWEEDDEETIHGFRRLAAGYAQEIELCQLAEGIYTQAEEDGILILKGFCVNKPAFRRLHGF